jgi:hypothetical protein
MSGAMQPGMAGGQPQIPPQVLQQLMAMRAQQGQGGAPQGAQAGPMAGIGQGGPTPVPQMGAQLPQPQSPPGFGGPPGAALQQPQPFQGVGSAAAQNPNLALFGQAAQMQQGQGLQQIPGRPGGGQSRMSPAEMARMGRFGDQVLGHLTPGEIQVPPELQTPKVLATLNQAFDKAGVSPQQFTAGSPQSSHNPATGAPEYSLWSALLPVVGAIGGSFIPGIGTAAGAALGGAVGGAAGGLIDHTGPLGMLLGAAGGGLGGYAGFGGFGSLGGLLGGASGAATGAADVAGTAGAAGSGVAGAAAGNAPFGAAAAAPSAAQAAASDNVAGWLGGAPTLGGTVPQVTGPVGGNLPLGAPAASPSWGQLLKGGLLAGTGASLGAAFAPPQGSNYGTPSGFGDPLPALNPNYGQLLGSNQSISPSFAGYNPYTSVAGPNPGFRFYPLQG